MALIDSLARFRLHLLSLPEQHYAGTCFSEYSCPVAYWLCCETNEWISIRITDAIYCMDAHLGRPRIHILPYWATLFVACVDAQRWRNGRHMTREEALYALTVIERELASRLLPERAASRLAWRTEVADMWLRPLVWDGMLTEEEIDQWLSCP